MKAHIKAEETKRVKNKTGPKKLFIGPKKEFPLKIIKPTIVI